MTSLNLYIRESVVSWHVGDRTYCLTQNSGKGRYYLVRVVPDENSLSEGYWLNDGQTFETESGAAWMILNEIATD